MSSILLDTNFIMTCVRQKIDFFDEFLGAGFHIIVPSQVVAELRRVARRENKKLKDRELAELGLKILEINKKNFASPNIGKKHVDKLIVKYAEKHPRLIVATLDEEMKRKLKNNIMVIRRKKRLEVV